MLTAPARMIQRRQLHFTDDALDQLAFDFAALAAESIADIARLQSGTPHLTERHQRITHEVFIAIRSTVDSLAVTATPLSHGYGMRGGRGVQHYRVLGGSRKS